VAPVFTTCKTSEVKYSGSNDGVLYYARHGIVAGGRAGAQWAQSRTRGSAQEARRPSECGGRGDRRRSQSTGATDGRPPRFAGEGGEGMADACQPMGSDVPMRTSPSGVCYRTEVPPCPSRCACVLARCVAPLPGARARQSAAEAVRRDTRCRCGALAAPRTFALLRPVATHPQEIRAATWNVAAVNNNPFEYWVTHPDPGTDAWSKRVCAPV